MKTTKIYPVNRLSKLISSLKKKRKKIAFTNGCFDILHAGHISYLKKAKQLADILVVAINSNESVKSIKGKSRPINSLRDRMEIVASLEMVDYVCSFNQPTPLGVINKLLPHVLVKGGDWKKSEIVGSNVVRRLGGTIRTIPFKKGYSTTKLIKKIASL